MWNFLKLNTILNLATILEILLQDLLVCDLITLLARFQKYWLSLTLNSKGCEKIHKVWGGGPGSTPTLFPLFEGQLKQNLAVWSQILSKTIIQLMTSNHLA